MYEVLMVASTPVARELHQDLGREEQWQIHNSTPGMARLDALLRRWRPHLLLYEIVSEQPQRELNEHLRSDAREWSVVLLLHTPPVPCLRGLVDAADDFLISPFRGSEVRTRIHRQLKKSAAEPRATDASLPRSLIGRDPSFKRVAEQLRRAANSNTTILVTGETGCGKGMMARAAHDMSPRAAGPFVSLNCGAVPPELIENEVFGHRRGAFTGASEHSKGLLAQASKGTLFLDEIDALPLGAQVKLLHVLDNQSYRQLGGASEQRADIRVIAATNASLERLVEEGRFRRDLYYRLNVLPIDVPPLRRRERDIDLLADHFIRKYGGESGHQALTFADDTLRALRRYDWPGNIRELQNVIQRIVLLSGPGIIEVHDLPPSIRPDPDKPAPTPESFREAKERCIASFERQYIDRLLEDHAGNISRAARTAGLERRTLGRLVKKHDLKRTNGRPTGPEGAGHVKARHEGDAPAEPERSIRGSNRSSSGGCRASGEGTAWGARGGHTPGACGWTPG